MSHRSNGKGNGDGPRPTPQGDLSGRLPPQNLEAERGVLAAILIDNDVLGEVVPILKVGDFYRDNHQTIYRAILELHDAGIPVDGLLLAEELSRSGEFTRIGGDRALSDLMASVPHAANAGYHAEVVAQKARRRELIEAANRMLRDGYSNDCTADELIARAERDVLAVGQGRMGRDTCPAHEVALAVIARMETRRGGVAGLRSPWHELDRMTDGFQPGQVYLVGARPSIGKTAIGSNLAVFAAIEQRTPTLFVSLEMNRLELAERILIARSGIPGHVFKDAANLVGARERAAIAAAADELDGAPLEIDDNPARTMSQIGSMSRRSRARVGLKLLVIDYLQLVTPGEAGDTRQEEVAEISRALKHLARELSIPVVCLCQLNRNVEVRADKKPTLADLRESGSLEQDADVVLLLHRPDFYRADDRPGDLDVIVAKNRNGPTGTVKLAFQKALCRAVDPAQVDPDPPIGAF